MELEVLQEYFHTNVSDVCLLTNHAKKNTIFITQKNSQTVKWVVYFSKSASKFIIPAISFVYSETSGNSRLIILL